MTCEAKHQQVCLGVVATAQHRQAVVHLQLAFRPIHAADLTAAPARLNQPTPPRCSELDRSGPPVVGHPHPLARRKLCEQRRPRAVLARRARTALDSQVVSARWAGRVDQKQEEVPRPLEPARFTCPAASAQHGRAGPTSNPERIRTHVRPPRSLARARNLAPGPRLARRPVGGPHAAGGANRLTELPQLSVLSRRRCGALGRQRLHICLPGLHRGGALRRHRRPGDVGGRLQGRDLRRACGARGLLVPGLGGEEGSRFPVRDSSIEKAYRPHRNN
jgi:hypothetical protein